MGTTSPTLRSWARHYGDPLSSPGTGLPRRYTPAEIRIFRSMRDQIARGRSSASAAGVVRSLTGRPAELTRDLLSASIRIDPVALDRVLTDAAEDLGVAGCIDDVILPTMRQIGAWWAAGRYTIPQEQMTTETVRAWLDQRSSRAPDPSHPQPILMACGPRDRHTIAAEALALLLRLRGWQCWVLGARISANSLMYAVAATPPAGVVVISHLADNRRLALEAVNRVHAADIEVFYAGNAFPTLASREGVPGTYLGNHLGDACTRICRRIDDAAPSGTPDSEGPNSPR